ncbi:hypothetical protein JT306_13945 [Salmonella enterica subsp. enterica serovar Kentucky]|nr:hypothetical protein [Salmonella enterica subsp. enterica serovar Kentucky]
MLTNLESQLKQQNAADKLDRCWRKSPRARGPRLYPLVTPPRRLSALRRCSTC